MWGTSVVHTRTSVVTNVAADVRPTSGRVRSVMCCPWYIPVASPLVVFPTAPDNSNNSARPVILVAEKLGGAGVVGVFCVSRLVVVVYKPNHTYKQPLVRFGDAGAIW